MVRTYGQTPAQLFRNSHPLPIQNLGTVVASASIPQVIEGVEGNFIYISDHIFDNKTFILDLFYLFCRYKVGKLCRRARK